MGSEQSSNNSKEDRRDINNRRHVQAEIDRALERQRKQFDQKVQQIIQNHSNTLGTPIQPLMSSSGLERSRTPYNYNQETLTGAVRKNTIQNQAPLYPNLAHVPGNGNSYAVPPETNQHNQNFTSSQNNQNDYVFVNTHSYSGPERLLPSAPPAPNNTSRERSTSRVRSGPDDNDISCPTCKYRFGRKIFNCASGHATCMDCYQTKRRCAICNCPITERRNITMEQFVSERKVACENADEGCQLSFKVCDMQTHLNECPFQETQCLLPGGLCRWKGKLSRMSAHFDTFHPQYRGDVDTEMSLQLHNICDNKRIQLIKIGNFNFVFHLLVSESDDVVYVAVQLLGTKVSAHKWTYEIHIYNKAEPRRKYQYSDKCFSSGEELNDIVQESACAVLPLKYAKTFINNGAIAYKFYIKKNLGNPEPGKARGNGNMNDDGEPRRQRDPSNNRRGRGRGRGGYRKA